MTTLTFPPKSAAERRRRPLRFSQAFESNAVSRLPDLEVAVFEEAILAYSVDEATELAHALDVKPLPWRYCALLIFLGSAACYAIGFAVVLAFNRLLSVL